MNANIVIIGLISALIVGLLSIIDYRRKGETVSIENVSKIVFGVWAVVSGVIYFSDNLTSLSKQVGGISDLDLDTGLPNF